MTLAALAPVIAATWPAARARRVGPFTVPEGEGGGNRVSAIRLTDPTATDATEDEIDAALAEQAKLDQAPLFMVLDTQSGLDGRLAARGLAIRDTTHGLIAPCAQLAAAPPPITCFPTWPPLAIQAEIWAEGGIGPARLAIMDRVSGPKISLFGRASDKPAGTAFVSAHGQTAMLHALEVAAPYRRQGLAAIMMRTAADWAQTVGALQLSVLVTQRNTPAQSLYTSLGFDLVGQYHYRTTAP